MASYLFKWAHPASEVFVTGTFDDWGMTIQLDKKGDHFEKRVHLSDPNKAVHYKFVVDTNWVTDPTAPQAHDGQNNLNNILRPEDMDREEDATKAFRTGVGAQSTTAMLASSVPKEDSKRLSQMPGEFPMTPVQDMPEFTSDMNKNSSSELKEEAAEDESKDTAQPTTTGENKEEAAEDESKDTAQPTTTGETKDEAAADEAKNTAHATTMGETPPSNDSRPQKEQGGAKNIETTQPKAIKDDTAEEQPSQQQKPDAEPQFSVNPLPATAGAGNPIDLKPGEKVPDPSSITSNTINSTVRLDRASYERSDSLPVLPPVVTPDAERIQKGTGVLDLPPITKNLIPESSLPMGGDEPQQQQDKDTGVHISSVAPESSTVALAAQVPLEPRDRTTPVNTAAETHHGSTEVPKIVEESQQRAHVDPEASAIPEAVAEKHAVEEELGKTVSAVPPTSEGTGGEPPVHHSTEATETPAAETTSGPTRVNGAHSKPPVEGAGGTGDVSAGPGTFPSGNIERPDGGSEHATGGVPAGGAVTTGGLPSSILQSIQQMNLASDQHATTEQQHVAPGVPEVVAESRDKAHWEPEAAANEEAVEEKKEVERELLQEVKATESAGEPAPTESAALTESVPQPTTGDQTTTTIPQGTTFAATETPQTEYVPVALPEQETPITTTSAVEGQQAMPISTPADGGLAASAASPAVPPITHEAIRSSAAPVTTKYTAPVTQGTTTVPLVTTGVEQTPTERVSTPQQQPTGAPGFAQAAAASAATSSPSAMTTSAAAASTPQKPGAPAPGQAAAALSTPKTAATSAASTPQAAGASGSVAADSPSSTTSKKEKRKSGFFGKLKEKLRK
ncbi:MAG: hypothetical protein M1823_004354 [Watsoniomyces obsoletus]|nr:MAG: hypothetical protein M1823_004354 [Watsoniomyces obsoletus]